jgi:hypothetical protein
MGMESVQIDGHWQPFGYGRCRFMVGGSRGRRACGAHTVASLLRGRVKPRRWGYCERHLAEYGRVMRHGEVWWDPGAADIVKVKR